MVKSVYSGCEVCDLEAYKFIKVNSIVNDVLIRISKSSKLIIFPNSLICVEKLNYIEDNMKFRCHDHLVPSSSSYSEKMRWWQGWHHAPALISP